MVWAVCTLVSQRPSRSSWRRGLCAKDAYSRNSVYCARRGVRAHQGETAKKDDRRQGKATHVKLNNGTYFFLASKKAGPGEECNEGAVEVEKRVTRALLSITATASSKE